MFVEATAQNETLDDRPPKRARTHTPTDGADAADPSESGGQSEHAVGIRQFVRTDLTRFTCELKSLNSDFQVFEVERSGRVVRLQDVPEAEELLAERAKTRARQEQRQEMVKHKAFDYESADARSLLEILGADVFDAVKGLVGQGGDTAGDAEAQPVSTSTATDVIDDKALRTRVHQCVREVFGGSLDTAATSDNRIQIKLRQGRNRSDRRSRNPADSRSSAAAESDFTPRTRWEHPGDYTIFTLYKDGRDTVEAVQAIASHLRLPAKVLTFAGTKDRRGCTTQRCTAYRTPINKLAHCNRFLDNIKLGDFGYVKKALALGDLRGNRFKLILRDVQGADEATVLSRFQLLRERGFVNYYGLQRFGTSTTGTHEPGIQILQDDCRAAVETILAAKSGARGSAVVAKQHWLDTRDAASTLDKMPHRNVAESAILKHMVKSGAGKGAEFTDWQNAIMAIPRGLRSMYLHAYQSFVWNHVVSARIERHGFAVLAGDLVEVASTTDTGRGDGELSPVRALTAEEVSAHSIFDIVLPLPGFAVNYPSNDLLAEYVSVMRRDNLDPLKMHRRHRDFSLPGAYRKIMSRPIDLQYRTLRYDDPAEQLADTELDRLRASTANRSTAASEPGLGVSVGVGTGSEQLPDVDAAQTDATATATAAGTIADGESGRYLAVECEFGLESAAYATMLLRECVEALPVTI